MEKRLPDNVQAAFRDYVATIGHYEEYGKNNLSRHIFACLAEKDIGGQSFCLQRRPPARHLYRGPYAGVQCAR
jgi:hypothetical protein